jgi:hypothetical protein
MWLFVELMKEYSEDIPYSVKFTHIPQNLILINRADTIVKTTVKAQGFELLSLKYLQKKRPLQVDLSDVKIYPTQLGYEAYITSTQVLEQVGKQIRKSHEIIRIKPDTLFFKFSELFRKQVPVRLRYTYSLDNQYAITDSVIFAPRTVIVTAIRNIIDTIQEVYTEKLYLSHPDSTVTLKARLDEGRATGLMQFSVDSVKVTFNIQQVTEALFKIPVQIESGAASVEIFPNAVDLFCKVPLKEYPRLSNSDFSAKVIYSPACNTKKLKVELTNFPAYVRVLRIEPSEVEYIVISK